MIIFINAALGLVHMQRVDNISKKGWRPTALQEHI